MSTRCLISVSDGAEEFHIYRHHDGYPAGPHGVVATLKAAFPYAWPLPRFEASDFAAALIRGWKEKAGGIYLSEGADCHGDLEWLYVVTSKAGQLQIQISKVAESSTPTFVGTLEAALSRYGGNDDDIV